MRNLAFFILPGIILTLLIMLAYLSCEATGQAGWYGANDKTDPLPHTYNADGSRFDENAFTCALRSRDFGRHYRVTNINNGRSVTVKHTDFGPALTYKGRRLYRIMDLSKAAFAAIADLEDGVVTVRVKRL